MGSIPFSRFMEHALYDPEEGYYGSGRAAVGRAGDFLTSVSVGSVFGELLAGQFIEMRAALGAGGPFVIVEQGANDGSFARDVLGGLAGIPGISYVIVEPFEILRKRQAAAVAGFDVSWVDSLEELPPFEGVHFSNELFDALPFDVVRSTGTGWVEMRVGWSGGKFCWEAGDPVSPGFPARAEGYTTEVRRSHRPILKAVAERMTRGFLLAIDYGFSAVDYLAPHRIEGTLSCYSGHRRDGNPLEAPGTKDITAHVNFSQLAGDALDLGFEVRGYTDQHHFLVGAASRMLAEADGAAIDRALSKKLGVFKTLMHPETMGTQFHAILLATGISGRSGVSGFRYSQGSEARLFSE